MLQNILLLFSRFDSNNLTLVCSLKLNRQATVEYNIAKTNKFFTVRQTEVVASDWIANIDDDVNKKVTSAGFQEQQSFWTQNLCKYSTDDFLD